MHPSLLVLQDALDRRLEGPDRLAVDEHLGACDACRRRLHALRWTRLRLAGVAGSLPMAPGLHADIRRLLGGARTPAAPPARSGAPPPPAAVWRKWFRWRSTTGERP